MSVSVHIAEMEGSNSNKKRMQIAYKYILDGLLAGVYRPGSNLRINDLCASLKMSQTPIKQALVELEGERLLEKNGKYYSVFNFSRKEVLDLYEVRRIIEGEAAAMAAERAERVEIVSMRRLLGHLTSIAEQEEASPVKFAELSGEFHRIIVRASGNKLLMTMTEDILKRLKIIRITSLTSFDRRADDITEHLRILEAIENREGSLARERMTAHLNLVTNYIGQNLLTQFYE